MCACQYHYNVSAPCTCSCDSHGWRRRTQVGPEFVVGQQVKDEDYDRLPVGAKAGTIEKTGEREWRDLDGRPLFQSPHATRHLNYLPEQLDPEGDSVEAYCVKDAQDGDWWVSEATPEFGYGIVYSDGTHPTKTNDLDAIEANYGIDARPVPEDKDDLYVEPEPLKEGDPAEVWDQALAWVARMAQTTSAEVAIQRAEGGFNPYRIRPARCTSLKRTVGNRAALWQCTRDEHADGSHECGDVEWTTAEESGRITEGGAS